MAGQYIVSARKYRPQTFDTVVGQEHITTTLKNAIKNDQVAHSYLFCGPRGIGKTSCARILAKALNCTDRGEDMEACGKCSSCTSFNENTSFAIYELDAASNNSVDDVRELTEQVRFAPQGGKYKVYIIDEVHMLSGQAFNAFLKTLEEPPHYAIFILATTEKHKILPTILSRCQIFDFKRIRSEKIINHLSGICEEEKIKFETDALQLIAQKSEGCMRDALSIMDKVASFSNQNISYDSALEHLNMLDYDFYFKLIDAIVMQDVTKSLLLCEEVLQRGFEPQTIMGGLAEHYRDLLVCGDEAMAKLLDVTPSIKKKYYTQSNLLSHSFIVNGLSVCAHTEEQLRVARNKRLQLELGIIKLNHLQDAVQILQEGNELVKKKIVSQERRILHTFLPKEPATLSIEEGVTPAAYSASEEQPTVSELKEEIPEKKETPVAPRPKKTQKLSGGLSSLRNAKEKIREKIQEEAQTKEKVEITFENLQAPLQKIYEDLSNKKTFYRSSIERSFHELNDTILTVHTPMLSFALFKDYKMEMKAELAEHFNNEDFELYLAEIPEEDTGVKIQSKREIFEELAEKNKHLLTLRDQMGFDIIP
jgi:DNA polymerase-3 subunit gamma/tau